MKSQNIQVRQIKETKLSMIVCVGRSASAVNADEMNAFMMSYLTFLWLHSS